MALRYYSYNTDELARLIRRRKSFRIKLPHNLKIYRPVYDVTFYIVGDVVAFDAAHQLLPFIGIIQKLGIKQGGVHWYDIQCIKRGQDRDPKGRINWLPKARINRSSILCEMRMENKYANSD